MLEMAAKLHISSSFSHKANDSPTSSSSSYSSFLALPQFLCTPFSSGFAQFKLHAKLGGGDGEVKPKEKKKFITKEEEPEQYWQSTGEREGENPMKTPLPYIIIFDAAWKKENNMAAFGCIFTNRQGRIHYQTTQAERNVPSPRVAEALALRWVLIAALLQGFSRICFNTDCRLLLAALTSKAPSADLHGIVQDINHFVMTQPQLQRPKNLSCLRSSPKLPHPRNVPASPPPITAQDLESI
ncbi:PREDICTED: uncharacterized protein LOC106306651 isoform X4 [Brassica oleracea var. oleracea]|uniref:uncharacterized protein LOC106306651 isoform X4 n=1 Tax=Brassica oleracea var. oleracea TaxID=109376 RepID=UPI0006A6F501|nr:PREDICTED: uncharacterized protein LOC106306651 isoform X4 [Brassica oleracea var. oleracea]